MGNCGSCGSSVPDGQPVCSMCYGDPEYGRDGYYRQWLEEQEQWHAEQESERLAAEAERIRDEEQEK